MQTKRNNIGPRTEPGVVSRDGSDPLGQGDDPGADDISLAGELHLDPAGDLPVHGVESIVLVDQVCDLAVDGEDFSAGSLGASRCLLRLGIV